MPADLTPIIEWDEPVPRPSDILSAPDFLTAVSMGHTMATTYRAMALAATEGWHAERLENAKLRRRLREAQSKLHSGAARG